MLVCLFVSRITQKLLEGFPPKVCGRLDLDLDPRIVAEGDCCLGEKLRCVQSSVALTRVNKQTNKQETLVDVDVLNSLIVSDGQ